MLSEILPQKLYVSDEHAAVNYQWLDQLNIKTLLRLDRDALYRKSWEEQVGRRIFKTVHLIDGGVGNTVESFLEAVEIVKTAFLEHTVPILVYCMAGVSRSTCICGLSLYAMKYQPSFDAAMAYMCTQHYPTNPNSEIANFVRANVISKIDP